MTDLLSLSIATVTRGTAPILSDVSFGARAGEFIGVVGPNGAGKSTLLRALVGLEPLAGGSCLIENAPVSALSPRERARRLSYLPQLREVAWDMTAEAVVALGRFAYGAAHRLSPEDGAAINRAIAAAGADAFRTRIVTSLSGGEQARIHLARAFAGATPILIADEPISALDPRGQLAIMTALKSRAEEGGLVVAALHELDLAVRFCTRMLVISEGRLVADAAPEEALSPATIQSVFGVSASELRGENGERALSLRPLG